MTHTGNKLTPLEKRYHEALLPGKVVTFAEFLSIKPPEPVRKIDLVRTNIKMLRKNGIKIKTIKGVGYQLEDK